MEGEAEDEPAAARGGGDQAREEGVQGGEARVQTGADGRDVGEEGRGREARDDVVRDAGLKRLAAAREGRGQWVLSAPWGPTPSGVGEERTRTSCRGLRS